MKAPLGAEVGLYFDGWTPLEPYLHALVTPSGRVYLVVAVRVQQKGKHRGRQHLRCVVSDVVPEGAQEVPLHWYARGK